MKWFSQVLWTCFVVAGTGVQQAESNSKVSFMFFTSFVNSKELAKSETVSRLPTELRILMSFINVFQSQIEPFIDIWNWLYSQVVFFPVFPTLGVQNLFFPGRYLPVNTAVKTGYCPKPSNPARKVQWHLAESISQEIPQPSINKIHLKITYLNFHSYP